MESNRTPASPSSPSARVAGSWLSSFRTGIRLRVALTSAAILILAILAAAAFLTPLPRSWSNMRPAIFFSMVILCVVVAVVVLLVRVRLSGRNRAAALDRAWSSLAEQSARYTRSGRRYHGRFNGRKFDAYVNQVREAHATVSSGVYAGEHVEIVLDTSLKVRLRAGRRDKNLAPLTARFQGELTSLDRDAPEGLTVLVHDANWGRWALRDEKASEMLSELLQTGGSHEIRSLSI